MSDLWKRIESWLGKNAPEVLADLQPGASDAALAGLSKTVGAALPEGFRAVYAGHDGQGGHGPALVPPWQLLPIADIPREWTLMKGLLDRGTFAGTPAVAVGPVQAVWWHPGWIPVGANGDGDLVCLDLAPAPGGEVGQILVFLHTHEKRERIAASLPAWLEAFAGELERGLYRLEDGELVRVSG
jgi:cell wall assembly regulator SMI1